MDIEELRRWKHSPAAYKLDWLVIVRRSVIARNQLRDTIQRWARADDEVPDVGIVEGPEDGEYRVVLSGTIPQEVANVTNAGRTPGDCEAHGFASSMQHDGVPAQKILRGSRRVPKLWHVGASTRHFHHGCASD